MRLMTSLMDGFYRAHIQTPRQTGYDNVVTGTCTADTWLRFAVNSLTYIRRTFALKQATTHLSYNT